MPHPPSPRVHKPNRAPHTSKDASDAVAVTREIAALTCEFCRPADAAQDGRLTKYMMGWTVGMPMETHLSITAMCLSGAFVSPRPRRAAPAGTALDHLCRT